MMRLGRQDNFTTVEPMTEAVRGKLIDQAQIIGNVIEWAHWEIMRRVYKYRVPFLKAREEVIDDFEKRGEEALHANGTPGPLNKLLGEIFPELPVTDIMRITRWFHKRSRRIRKKITLWKFTTRNFPPRCSSSNDGEGVVHLSKNFTPFHRQSSRSHRSPVRSAAKSGGDDGGGDGDSDQGEPPRPSYTGRVIPPAPIQARQFLLTPRANKFPFSRIVLPCYWCMGGRRAA